VFCELPLALVKCVVVFFFTLTAANKEFHVWQVRATNLQELVYKNGQAGVTKATVSITFENLDKKQSPLGYEQYDEIVVTRQVSKALDISHFS
jgi:hypothetical protein